jgi:hypothetical protein
MQIAITLVSLKIAMHKITNCCEWREASGAMLTPRCSQ